MTALIILGAIFLFAMMLIMKYDQRERDEKQNARVNNALDSVADVVSSYKDADPTFADVVLAEIKKQRRGRGRAK